MNLLCIIQLVLMVHLAQSKLDFQTSDFPALHAIVNFFAGSSKGKTTRLKPLTTEQLGPSLGECQYAFYWMELYKSQCEKGDGTILHLLNLKRTEVASTKPSIMVRCLQPVQTPNSTLISNSLRMLHNVAEVLEFLKPIGNGTKRHEPGNCVLMLFYSQTSIGCCRVAPHINVLPHMFPTLRMGVIDVSEISSFNAEFGIVGLPTVLLFHQGRPIVKFYGDYRSFSTFVTRHTGIKPIQRAPTLQDLSEPLLLKPLPEPMHNLFLAWAFIITCAAYYFLKSKYFKRICDVIKSIWQESEAQLEQ